MTDLHETLSEHKSDKLGDIIEAKWKAEEENARKANREPSLWRVLLKTFGFKLILYSLPIIANELFVKYVPTYIIFHSSLCCI